MDGADSYSVLKTGPVGLDRRPRPASVRQRILRGLIQSAPFSSLQRRIIFFNLIGLAILVLGVLYLNQFRTGLIEQRLDALRTQAQIIAITLVESSALDHASDSFDPDRAALVLERLAKPTRVRGRLYDPKLRLIGDTRTTAPDSSATPAVEGAAPLSLFEKLEDAYLRLVSTVRGTEFPRAQQEVGVEPHALAANTGEIAQGLRLMPGGELSVSVAVPLRRGEEPLGVLMLSTEGGDINRIVQRERLVILQVFIIATFVSVALSVLLANTIAIPIRRLSEAADPHDEEDLKGDSGRIEIPDMTERTDEIGDLSAAMMRMTRALYRRIDAIESFAADVSHEIKNPLTSLRSAVETMAFTKTPEQRQRLLDVIKHDVGRLDRLVTDISNASRLDAELVRERMQRFDLGELVTTLAEITEMQGADRGVRVVTRLPVGPLTARGLESRLAQVITNLLDNALSFSPERGTILIVGKRGSNGSARLEVSDQGPGIPDENLATIFERFYSERPDAEGFGNHSGLGLSISRQIVDAHGGRIWAENLRTPGMPPDTAPVGARFIIELP